jgi:hypothetical protein
MRDLDKLFTLLAFNLCGFHRAIVLSKNKLLEVKKLRDVNIGASSPTQNTSNGSERKRNLKKLKTISMIQIEDEKLGGEGVYCGAS